MGPQSASHAMSMSEQADELEERMMHELTDKIATKSVLFSLADGKVEMEGGAALQAQNPGKYFLMGADPRLPKMPAKVSTARAHMGQVSSLARLVISSGVMPSCGF